MKRQILQQRLLNLLHSPLRAPQEPSQLKEQRQKQVLAASKNALKKAFWVIKKIAANFIDALATKMELSENMNLDALMERFGITKTVFVIILATLMIQHVRDQMIREHAQDLREKILVITTIIIHKVTTISKAVIITTAINNPVRVVNLETTTSSPVQVASNPEIIINNQVEVSSLEITVNNRAITTNSPEIIINNREAEVSSLVIIIINSLFQAQTIRINQRLHQQLILHVQRQLQKALCQQEEMENASERVSWVIRKTAKSSIVVPTMAMEATRGMNLFVQKAHSLTMILLNAIIRGK